MRLEAASRRHLGARYRMDPLGEGPGGKVDRDPLQTWASVDCVTYAEQCLAEALASSPREVAGILRRIRYRGGVVAFETRNHFMVADWIPNNRWCVADITEAVGGPACGRMEKTIDRAALLRRRGGDARFGGAPQRLQTAYIPRAAVASRAAAIPPASMILLITNRPGLFAAHVGLVFVRRGERVVRHASQRRGRVIEEWLAAFVARSPSHVVGIKVCAFHRPREG